MSNPSRTIRQLSAIEMTETKLRYADGGTQDVRILDPEDLLNEAVDKDRDIGLVIRSGFTLFGRVRSIEDEKEDGLVVYFEPRGSQSCRVVKYENILGYFYDA